MTPSPKIRDLVHTMATEITRAEGTIVKAAILMAFLRNDDDLDPTTTEILAALDRTFDMIREHVREGHHQGAREGLAVVLRAANAGKDATP